ncbi:cell wall-associated NlpC family hydrolase [Paenibacillus phyllosphaerae]|uniref:Cell wall-associated NlpC family hydrolase n=1 Tax=Paenibacillus phyllosphaerae TaxID=274593 RepID=A0A7W5FP55_9BACL|nr:cell wall-associated NlpC family hydrolase [Paenibacillus phyllosphaerae]
MNMNNMKKTILAATVGLSVMMSAALPFGDGGQAYAATSTTQANKIISAGKKYLGTPYQFGSSRYNTSTFDCSDFVRQAFLDGLGVKLPSDSRQQATYVKNKTAETSNWRNLKPGHLMFFMSYKGTSKSAYAGINKSAQRITHVGIYLGNGKVLHTYSNAGGGVTISNIAGTHWEYRFVFGGSAL